MGKSNITRAQYIGDRNRGVVSFQLAWEFYCMNGGTLSFENFSIFFPMWVRTHSFDFTFFHRYYDEKFQVMRVSTVVGPKRVLYL